MNRKDQAKVTAAAVAIALAAAAAASAQVNVPKPSYKFEKCYGIARAGENDCFSESHQCGGTSTEDRDADAWIYVPAGSCKKIVDGSLSPKAK